MILWAPRPAYRGDNTIRRKKLQSAPDFCPSPVVIMINHSDFLICAGFHVDSLHVLEVSPTYEHPRVHNGNVIFGLYYSRTNHAKQKLALNITLSKKSAYRRTATKKL